jgi:hypothetical protein
MRDHGRLESKVSVHESMADSYVALLTECGDNVHTLHGKLFFLNVEV